MFGGVFIILGLLGSFIHAFILDRFKKFKLQFIFITLLSLIAIFALAGALSTENIYIVTPAIGFFGMALIPIIGVGYSFVAMQFLPISAAVSCGIVHIANALLSVVITSIVSIFVETHEWVAVGTLCGCTFLGAFCSLFTRSTI